MNHSAGWHLVALAAAALAACGGGDGGGSNPPPPPPGPITLADTAARGAALAGASVSVKCAAGTPTAVTSTTAGTGAYSVTIDNASLPCVLRVTGTGGEVFHSVVAGTAPSGTYTANLSPLTEMMVARLAGIAPASFYDGFDSSTAVSAAALSQALAYVKSAIAKVADLGSANPVTDALVVGNALDQAIETTVAGMAAAGVSLTAATAAIAANPAAPTVLSAALAPRAAACAWLKSGAFRIIDAYDTESPGHLGLFQLNAASLSGTDPEGGSFTLTSDGDCRFSDFEGDFVTRLMVSSSGLIVAQGESTTDAERNFGFALPEQTLPLAELAGTWSAASWDPVSAAPDAGRVATMYEAVFDASGQMTALSQCIGTAACVVDSGPFSRLVVNPTGGFDEILPDGRTWARVFLYKTLDGRRVAVWITPERELIVAVPKGTQELPAAGSGYAFHEVVLQGAGLIESATSGSVNVTAVDTSTGTVARVRNSSGLADNLRFDAPRDGLRYRAPNDCTIGGIAVACPELVELSSLGLGFTISTSVGSTPAAAFFTVVVDRPI